MLQKGAIGNKWGCAYKRGAKLPSVCSRAWTPTPGRGTGGLCSSLKIWSEERHRGIPQRCLHEQPLSRSVRPSLDSNPRRGMGSLYLPLCILPAERHRRITQRRSRRQIISSPPPTHSMKRWCAIAISGAAVSIHICRRATASAAPRPQPQTTNWRYIPCLLRGQLCPQTSPSSPSPDL